MCMHATQIKYNYRTKVYALLVAYLGLEIPTPAKKAFYLWNCGKKLQEISNIIEKRTAMFLLANI